MKQSNFKIFNNENRTISILGAQNYYVDYKILSHIKDYKHNEQVQLLATKEHILTSLLSVKRNTVKNLVWRRLIFMQFKYANT